METQVYYRLILTYQRLEKPLGWWRYPLQISLLIEGPSVTAVNPQWQYRSRPAPVAVWSVGDVQETTIYKKVIGVCIHYVAPQQFLVLSALTRVSQLSLYCDTPADREAVITWLRESVQEAQAVANAWLDANPAVPGDPAETVVVVGDPAPPVAVSGRKIRPAKHDTQQVVVAPETTCPGARVS